MTDTDDKTGRHGKGWAASIPLVTLLSVIFGAGIIVATQRFTAKAVEDVGAKLDGHIKAESEARAVLDARIRTQEISAAVRDAVAKEGRKQR